VRQPRLWLLAALPFMLCLMLYAALFSVGWHWIGGWIGDALVDREGWWRWLGYVLWVLFWIVALILSVILFVPVAAILASPFNDLLSEKTERLYRGVELNEPFSLRALIRSLRVGLAGEVRRALTLAVLLLFALSLNLIPVIGQIAAATASTALTIYYLSLEFTSFSMDRRYYDWPAKRGFLRRFRARSLGFGSAAFLIMMIPIVNAFFIPVSAIAGTMLFCDTDLADEPPNAQP
jgi:CysZ protein